MHIYIYTDTEHMQTCKHTYAYTHTHISTHRKKDVSRKANFWLFPKNSRSDSQLHIFHISRCLVLSA